MDSCNIPLISLVWSYVPCRYLLIVFGSPTQENSDHYSVFWFGECGFKVDILLWLPVTVQEMWFCCKDSELQWSLYTTIRISAICDKLDSCIVFPPVCDALFFTSKYKIKIWYITKVWHRRILRLSVTWFSVFRAGIQGSILILKGGEGQQGSKYLKVIFDQTFWHFHWQNHAICHCI